MPEQNGPHLSANFIMNALSLATVMDESRMVFVMNTIFLESRCCFPVPSLCELNHAAIRSAAVIRPLTVDDLTIKCAEHMHTCMTLLITFDYYGKATT